MNINIIHDAGGRLSLAQGISPFIDSKYILKGIKPTKELIEQQNLSIESIASDYADKIITSQSPPYFLSGICIGGMIALEIARIYLNNQIEVSGIALFDPPMFFVQTEEEKNIAKDLWLKIKKPAAIQRRMLEGMTQEEAEESTKTSDFFINSSLSYEPKYFEFDQEVTFFYAQDNALLPRNANNVFQFTSYLNWQSKIKNFCLIPVLGYHDNLCDNVNIKYLAKAFIDHFGLK
jgi:thioesterase domain-containing protein